VMSPWVCLRWFCPALPEPVKPYFTRGLRVLTFGPGMSKIVILKGNGVVKKEMVSNGRKYRKK